MFKFGLNEKNKMEHLTTYLHRPRTTRSPLSFWDDLDFLYKSFSKLIKRVTRFNRAFKDFLIFLYFKLIILMFLNFFYAFISKTNLKNKNIILIYFLKKLWKIIFPTSQAPHKPSGNQNRTTPCLPLSRKTIWKLLVTRSSLKLIQHLQH